MSGAPPAFSMSSGFSNVASPYGKPCHCRLQATPSALAVERIRYKLAEQQGSDVLPHSDQDATTWQTHWCGLHCGAKGPDAIFDVELMRNQRPVGAAVDECRCLRQSSTLVRYLTVPSSAVLDATTRSTRRCCAISWSFICSSTSSSSSSSRDRFARIACASASVTGAGERREARHSCRLTTAQSSPPRLCAGTPAGTAKSRTGT